MARRKNTRSKPARRRRAAALAKSAGRRNAVRGANSVAWGKVAAVVGGAAGSAVIGGIAVRQGVKPSTVALAMGGVALVGTVATKRTSLTRAVAWGVGAGTAYQAAFSAFANYAAEQDRKLLAEAAAAPRQAALDESDDDWQRLLDDELARAFEAGDVDVIDVEEA